MQSSPLRPVRFLDLTDTDMNVELHIHTIQTDGYATIIDILEASHHRKFDAIAFTEHVRRDSQWFPQFANEVRQSAQNYPHMRVYVGCETKALDYSGVLDLNAEIQAECDVILGAVHRFPAMNAHSMSKLDEDQFAELEFKLSIGMLRLAPIHILAHPGGMFQRRFQRPFPEAYMRQIMETALEYEIMIEINSTYLSDFSAFLDLCTQLNPFVSIGSDVHLLEDIGRCCDMLRGER